MTTYTLAGGCFWCIDAVYRRLKGVSRVESGYANGHDIPTNYYRVGSGMTGHAEAVQISFDETVIPVETILDIFFLIHDPTTLNRQGADTGTQYRSSLMYANEQQKNTFEAAVSRARTHWGEPIVTEIVPLNYFQPAEPEHQDFFSKQPESGYCSIVIVPKIVKARRQYQQWFKEGE
jgi:peptide-methionine (S)-S-oxide reductase